MLLLLPNFGFLDTLNVPDDAGLKDDYQVDEWTDDNGVYHKRVSEFITFGNYASSGSGAMVDDDVEDETVIDASGDTDLSGPAAATPLKLPLKFRVF